MYTLCEVGHMNTLQAAAIETVIMCDALGMHSVYYYAAICLAI